MVTLIQFNLFHSEDPNNTNEIQVTVDQSKKALSGSQSLLYIYFRL